MKTRFVVNPGEYPFLFGACVNFLNVWIGLVVVEILSDKEYIFLSRNWFSRISISLARVY